MNTLKFITILAIATSSVACAMTEDLGNKSQAFKTLEINMKKLQSEYDAIPNNNNKPNSRCTSPHSCVIKRLTEQKTELLELYAVTNQKLIQHYSKFVKPLNDRMNDNSSGSSSPDMNEAQTITFIGGQQDFILGLLQKNQQILITEKQLRNTTK